MNVLRAALGRPRYEPAEEQAYRRLHGQGFRPAGIVDVGAYEGNWTRMALRIFPGTPALMIEPQEAKRAALDAVCKDLSGVSYASAVLGASAGEAVTFYEMETGSSLLPENSNVPRTQRQLITQMLDDVAADIDGPLFLKLDVQGAELTVLAGGPQTLARTEVVQLEVAMLPYNDGAPSFLETVSYMDERGFVPLDYSGFTRPNGRDLVQVDVLFAKRESPLRPKFFTF